MNLPIEDVSFVYDGLTFGGYGGSIIVNSLTINEPKYRGSSTENPVGHGGWGGRGLLGFGSWEFTLTTNGDSRDSSYDLHRQFYARWRGHLDQPDVKTRLYYRIGNRLGYVVGHPEDVSIPTPDVGTAVGVAKFSAKFIQTDPAFYTATADGGPTGSNTLMLQEVRTGATVLPAILPLVFGRGGATQARQGQLDNLGTAPSPFTVRITAGVGPLASPSISSKGWTITFPGLTIPAGRYVEVNTLDMTSKWDTGAAVWPATSSRLNSRLVPGPQEVTVNGSDTTNTARFEFSWFEGSYSI